VATDRAREQASRVGGSTLESFAKAPRLNAWLYGQFRDAVHGEVLEIGSGLGTLSRLILGDAGRLVVTDVEPRYLAALRRDLGGQGGDSGGRARVEVAHWNLDEPPPAALRARRFDTIVAINVLEHVRDDAGAVRALAALLRPGGRLLVYVPACPFAFGTLDVALGHHRRYTRTSLAALWSGTGLDPTPARYVNRLGLAGWLLNGRLLGRRSLSPAMVTLFDRIVGVARAVDRLLAPLPCGLGLVARATKPPGAA
jgi:SAM-dependent methyltransferase